MQRLVQAAWGTAPAANHSIHNSHRVAQRTGRRVSHSSSNDRINIEGLPKNQHTPPPRSVPVRSTPSPENALILMGVAFFLCLLQL
jgi:hypothetical protein